jgi:oligoribonuclease (3'-5' exoribonuclease)
LRFSAITAWNQPCGLDPERDRIIEIATLVTDANLNILAEGPTIAVHHRFRSRRH